MCAVVNLQCLGRHIIWALVFLSHKASLLSITAVQHTNSTGFFFVISTSIVLSFTFFLFCLSDFCCRMPSQSHSRVVIIQILDPKNQTYNIIGAAPIRPISLSRSGGVRWVLRTSHTKGSSGKISDSDHPQSGNTSTIVSRGVSVPNSTDYPVGWDLGSTFRQMVLHQWTVREKFVFASWTM